MERATIRLSSGRWGGRHTCAESLRNIQQRDVAHVFCLLTGFADPEISVVVTDDVLRSELLHVDESQPREGGKDEDVAD